MWEAILVTVIATVFIPINTLMGKVQSNKYMNLIIKCAVFSLTVLVCTFIIMMIRNKLDVITVDLTDKGVAKFTATSSHTEPVKSYNGKRTVTTTHYYVIYYGKIGNHTLKYSKKVIGQDEMHRLVKDKDVITLRVFEGTDGKIYYGKESDTVESYLAANVAWKSMYYKILLVFGIALAVFVIVFIVLSNHAKAGKY